MLALTQLSGGHSGGTYLPLTATTAANVANAAALPQPADQSAALQSQLGMSKPCVNDSGRSVYYRVDPRSGNRRIQEINPATGNVIAEYPVSEFPVLARSAGLVGVLVDYRA
jgi:hypothetical protein